MAQSERSMAQYERTLASLRAGVASAAMVVAGCFAAAIFFSGSQLEAQAPDDVKSTKEAR